MSVDRLKALRAQRQNATVVESPQALEMQATNRGESINETEAFLSEVSSINQDITQLAANIRRISELQSQSLSAVHTSTQNNDVQLEELIINTRTLQNSLRDRIQSLSQPRTGHEAQIWKNQTALVRSKFLETLQDYAKTEQKHRQRTQAAMTRQLLVVKPDASPTEIDEFINNGNRGEVFTQALTTSTRYGDGRVALKDVQARQHDLQRMEKTLTELAELFQSMGELVAQADDTLVEIEKTTLAVAQDTEQADKQLVDAVRYARSWRKKKWICFGIFVLVLAIVGIVLGIELSKK